MILDHNLSTTKLNLAIRIMCQVYRRSKLIYSWEIITSIFMPFLIIMHKSWIRSSLTQCEKTMQILATGEEKQQKYTNKPQCHQLPTSPIKLQIKSASEKKLPKGLQKEATLVLSWISLRLLERECNEFCQSERWWSSFHLLQIQSFIFALQSSGKSNAVF